jgi:hypothetical protein
LLFVNRINITYLEAQALLEVWQLPAVWLLLVQQLTKVRELSINQNNAFSAVSVRCYLHDQRSCQNSINRGNAKQ